MPNSSNSPVIAYLAPEIPALSATFVYEELLALERRGLSVIPITVRRPRDSAFEQTRLEARTQCLYEGSLLVMSIQSLAVLPLLDFRLSKALRWLAADILELGIARPSSWKLAFQFLASIKLARLLRQHGCSHLHVHFAHTPTQIAMYASALTSIPFTIMGHANDIFEHGVLLPRKAERARKFLTISRYNYEYLQRLGVDPGKLAIIRCGIRLGASQAVPPAKDTRHEPYQIGTLGRLIEKKGMDVLIAAMVELRREKRKVELSIAGDGPLRRALEAQVCDQGLVDQVRFVGILPHSEVADWMRSQAGGDKSRRKECLFRARIAQPFVSPANDA